MIIVVIVSKAKISLKMLEIKDRRLYRLNITTQPFRILELIPLISLRIKYKNKK